MGASLYCYPDQPQGPPSLPDSGYWGSCPWHSIDQPPPSSSEVKKEWRYTCTSHLCLHGMLQGELILDPIFCLCQLE